MGGKKDDITIIVAFIQEKLYRNNHLKNNAFKSSSYYNISEKIKQIPQKIFNPTEDFIKNFENLNLNNGAGGNSKNEDFLSLNKNEYLNRLDKSNNNLNDSFH